MVSCCCRHLDFSGYEFNKCRGTNTSGAHTVKLQWQYFLSNVDEIWYQSRFYCIAQLLVLTGSQSKHPSRTHHCRLIFTPVFCLSTRLCDFLKATLDVQLMVFATAGKTVGSTIRHVFFVVGNSHHQLSK